MAYTKSQIKDIFNYICSEIEKGRALRNILMQDDNTPSTQTFYVWLENDENLSKQYARACEVRADIIFDEMIDIADDGRNDYTDTEIGYKFNSEHVQRSKLRIDARKWMLSKMNPKKYGDRTDITTNGKDIVTKYSEMTDEEIKAQIKRLSERP